MRRFTLTIIISLLVVICQAQGHLSFMDIKFDCSLDAFCNKLITNKGLTAGTMTDGEQYRSMETKKLTGDFYGVKNCTFYVRKHERLDNVSSVIVEDTLGVLSDVDVKRIISIHDKQFGNHEKDSTMYFIWYIWKTENGEVELSLRDNGFKAFYTDTTEIAVRKAISDEFNREWERQTVKEICGIPFGSSYENTKEVLENKYGSPSIFSDKTKIYYENKSYAGIFFDDIIFLFQSDGYKSYLNGCVFILEASSLKDAKEKCDILYRKLRIKYDMEDGIDDNGNKYYIGGHSPVPFDGFGFSIEILKYDNKARVPYAARLMYGRYNYIREEF
ncbi:MAG: hypothetical protein IKD75_09620 [Prevotella sp.]|nr:hypothetical protein [Prevotella sp.]